VRSQRRAGGDHAPGPHARDGRAPDEHDLVRRVRAGDDEAFAVLFDRHGGTVFRYAWGLADVRSDVDDLVQETFLVAWRRRDALTVVGTSVLPWLLTTCRNASLNLNRQRRRVRLDELDDGVAQTHGPAWYRKLEHDAAIEQLAHVQDAIDALPEIDRRLCELCLIEGRSYDEAATLLGLTPASARKRIQRSRTRLRAARATD